MTTPPPSPGPPMSARTIVGRALLASAVILGVFAAGIWAGWIPIGTEQRGILSLALGAAAAADLVIGLRFLGEQGS